MKLIRTLSRGDLNHFACGGFMLCLTFAVATASIRSAWAGAPSLEPDLLEAEKAFAISARIIDDRTFELRYAIANGYYMYRDRFRFSVNGQPVSISRQAWPAGKWKQDASFGKVVTYRNGVRLLLPFPLTVVDRTQASLNPLTLTVSSQGCADAGICYPPLHQMLTLIPGSSAWVGPQEVLSSGFSHEGRSGSALTDRLTSGKQ